MSCYRFNLKVCTFLCLLLFTNAIEFQIKNNVPGPIWVGILGNSGHPSIGDGGFALNQGEQRSVHSSDNWAGRFWARTWCDSNSRHCQTGDCGNKLKCTSGGVPPATLVEIQLKGYQGQDFYDISLVDGFNVVASIAPLGGQGNCKKVACSYNLNNQCPQDLRLIGGNGRDIIGCYSSCSKFNTEQYCCSGRHNTPQTCSTNNWPVNSARYFKSHCPDAYSYAYDDATSTFTCKAPAYRITFG